MLLQENERIDEVNDKLRLIQKTDGLTFGTDALLLAAFAKKPAPRALELGGGSGIISMLLAARGRFNKIDCLEIQEEYAELIGRNARLNGLEETLTPILGDVRSFPEKTSYGSYDAVFSNPPYMTDACGAKCQNEAKDIARHELCGTIADFALCASRALKYGGAFYVVYRTERLADLLCACRAVKLEPKRLTFVHARRDAEPSMLLLEARLGGKPSLAVTRPLILSENGEDSDDVTYILNEGIFPTTF
ncbi:MAG: methyltransferase [Clostridia bacterium]|nr:methyltransferase [Clostridia bacterium]